MNDNRVTLALPSKGAIAEPKLDFLRSCDLRVLQMNPRQYMAAVPVLPEVDVLFQRVGDIVYQILDGTVVIGIDGLDIVHGIAGNSLGDEVLILQENLRYGGCQILMAIPEAWIDVD